jgi:phage shock protein E
MNKKKLFILLFMTAITTFALLGANINTPTIRYKKITDEQAKEMMNQNTNIIILDVRTEEEFDTGHIEGAKLISYDKIAEKEEIKLLDKSSTILVYCRTGRRSALATKTLIELGFTNVYDFGGMNDWQYDIVTN